MNGFLAILHVNGFILLAFCGVVRSISATPLHDIIQTRKHRPGSLGAIFRFPTPMVTSRSMVRVCFYVL